MKGKGHYKTFPIIVTETEPEKMRQAIYSKIMLEQDVSNIPITQHIILVGEQVNNEDVESFQEKCNEGATVNRLELNKVGIVKERKDEITPEKIAQYAIPIALAWKTLDTKNKAFFPSNLLPTKIIERQKHFKIAWHGFFVLGAIFYFTFMGTTKNMTLKQQILNAQQINRELELEIRQKQNIITKISQIRSEISVLEDNILKIENLIGSKNQWHYILNVIANAFLENEISWINNLKSSEDNFQISGYTTQKRNIIRFSKLFLNGRIERITKHLMQDLTIWRYDMTFPYPDPKDIEKEKEEGLSKIQIAELTEEPPEPEPEPITKEPIKPETFEIEVSEVNIKEIYNNIVSIYFKRNTQDAYERFKEFIIKYPDHKLAHNANYLMGECLYTLGKISEAKVIFENTIKQKGTKTPDALMMLGNSYFKENDINNAIYYWNQLVTNYPDHKLAIIAKNKINTFSSLENIYKEKSESKPRATIVEKEVVKKEVYELQLLSR
ncbi:MAG: tetratricopeptide repeat protein, partial [Candidatus Cloacimonetes bacterium]|nr:tetratricopeptide repeat protein [Candidatus Cloacimonadota bacterium]